MMRSIMLLLLVCLADGLDQDKAGMGRLVSKLEGMYSSSATSPGSSNSSNSGGDRKFSSAQKFFSI